MHSFVVILFVDDVNKRENKGTMVFVIFFLLLQRFKHTHTHSYGDDLDSLSM